MAVLIVAEVTGQTQEKYDHMMEVLGPVLRGAKGFITHGAGRAGGAWRTFEVWESAADATRFFADHIHPNLPEGVKPKRTLTELHSLIVGEAALRTAPPHPDGTARDSVPSTDRRGAADRV